MSFSTIASPRGLRGRYRRKVSLKRSAQRSNFSGEIEAGLASTLIALRLDVLGNTCWFRNHHSISPKAVDMEADRLANFVLYRRNCVAGCDATGQIRYIRRIIAVGFLDDDRVAHQCWSFRPDCFKILFSVPEARSSEGLPATVTRPGRTGCLYCR